MLAGVIEYNLALLIFLGGSTYVTIVSGIHCTLGRKMTAMGDAERRERAAARRVRATLYKTPLASSHEDPQPIFGAEAVALVQRLTEESWSLAGEAAPRYTRAQIPWRFVPRRRR